jgi:aspartate aminotransferase-like enzyme/GNAT superfamily N-acetyltransferase
MRSDLVFKIAETPEEIEQIHRLNYETFVEEIPQHHRNPERRLVDRFHDENTYLIALHEGKLVGMMAARGNRPFSLDLKLENLDSYLPEHTSICEFRLLAVRPEYRGGKVLPGLMDLLNRYCIDHGHDLGIISGTTRQQKLYRHLGFKPFGPLVGTGDAVFQPMYLTVDAADRHSRPLLRLSRLAQSGVQTVSFLPGPVSIAPEVQAAFAALPISHRGDTFQALLETIKTRLRAHTGAAHLEILTGSGTTANDAVAAQLSLLPGRGLILSNGEFGDRLLDHASRFGLDFKPVRTEWGEAFDFERIAGVVEAAQPAWIWTVHCDTSTGVINDLGALKQIARAAGAKLALDCIGSIGTIPLDLGGVFLATATSGKGLASYAGLGIVFSDHVPVSNPRLPRSLDLGYFAEQRGVPFTLLSNHLAALNVALDRLDRPDHFAGIAAFGTRVRQALEAAGFRIVAAPEVSSPAVLTIAIEPQRSAEDLGDALVNAGFLTSYQSIYLRSRNWIQVCLMGTVTECDIDRLVELLEKFAPPVRAPR